MAALLASRGAVRDAGPRLEHDDEHVRGLVLRRGERGDHSRRQNYYVAWDRRVFGSGDGGKELGAAVGWVVLTMTAVIILYDQLMFRPLVAWADKFRFEQTSAQTVPSSWFLDLLQRSRLLGTVTNPGSLLLHALARRRFAPLRQGIASIRPSHSTIDVLWFIAVAAGAVFAAWKIID